ncbi:hypothetical protein HQ587_00715 [bacterium]|nr:hypothetical protein [bacterium]
MYVGLAVFIIGILALIAFVIESSRSASNPSAAGSSELLHRRLPTALTASHNLPHMKNNNIDPILGKGYTLNTAPGSCSIPRVNSSSLAAGLYRNSSSKKGVFQRREDPYRDTARRIPKDLILTRARQGVDELEIAHGLGIGRDAVAMVLNLYGDPGDKQI